MRTAAIIIHYEHPPIPIRTMDWSAWRDGDEPDYLGHMRIGFGPNPEAALKELLELEERDLCD